MTSSFMSQQMLPPALHDLFRRNIATTLGKIGKGAFTGKQVREEEKRKEKSKKK